MCSPNKLLPVDLDAVNFCEGDGDGVVLALDLLGDVDGQIDGLSITATGALDEVSDVGLV